MRKLKRWDRPIQAGSLMAGGAVDELERLVRRLLEAWDAWMDTDTLEGPEYEALNAAVQGLRRHLEEHEVSLWFGPTGRHTLRFDEIELAEISSLMQAISARQPVQISDFRRNILGTWRAGELRQAADELARLERCHLPH